MIYNRNQLFSAFAILLGSIVFSNTTYADPLILPDIDGNSAACDNFGDFVGCSITGLNLLEDLAAGTYVPPPSGVYSKDGSYTVPTNQGFLADQLTIATNPTGQAANNSDYETGGVDSIDNAYGPGGSGSLTGFSTDDTPSAAELTAGVQPVADPGGANEFTGDSSNTWDITLDTLIDNFLTVDDVIYDPKFIFGNNQVGSGPGQDISLWALLALVDNDNVLDDKIFEFTNSGDVDPTIFTSDKDLGDDPAIPADFVVVDGLACFDAAFQITTCGGPDEAVRFSNNLGNNEAEFIGYLPELTAADLIAFRAQGYDTLSVDERYFDNTNGFEDTFMVLGNATVNRVPEPSTILLLGLAMTMFGYSVGKRKTS